MWYKIKRVLTWVNEECLDMQWPAPIWFHVPLQSERQAIYNSYTWLWLSWSTNFSTYLKLPMAGRRYYDKSISNVGSNGYYRSSSSVENDSDSVYAHCLVFNSSSVLLNQNSNSRSNGFSVRCLKDSPVTPTSSWTTLYQWSWSAWIFHNANDWVISLSSDWTTWYTLMDKNLWATTVYNYWNTLTDANCGNLFQRWNNYAFPWGKSSDSITSSSTKVNVTWYWPWNYYSSSTWITKNPWQDSANNWNNLRWWVSQWSWTRFVEKQIYPATH